MEWAAGRILKINVAGLSGWIVANVPGPSVFVRLEKPVGLRVIDDRFRFRVPDQRSAELI